MVMFLGRNGSGKSTIMSLISPYKDSSDERKVLILDGKDGRKEIDIEHEGHRYEIVHLYSASSQSFIRKDGVELNENGGVRSCEELINKELGITKDYFRIGKIGSNTKSFIDYTTTERKNYITNFLNIEEIIKNFNVVKSKLQSLKKEISTVSSDLQTHETKETIETKITNLEAEMSRLDSELTDLLPKKGALIEKKNNTETLINASSNMPDLLNRKKEKENDIFLNNQIKENLEEELENTKSAEEEKEKHQEKCFSLQKELSINENERTNKNLLLTDCKNKLAATKLELNGLGKPEDLEKVQREIIECEGAIEKLKVIIRENPAGLLVNSMQQNKKDINKNLQKFITFTNFIEKYFVNLQAPSAINSKRNIDLFFDASAKESFERQILESRKVIQTKQNLLLAKEKEVATLSTYISQLENLKKRPSECNIESCPFIKGALEHKNVLEDISNLNSEISSIKKELEELDVKAENLQEVYSLFKNFEVAYEEVSPRENDILASFISEKSLLDYIKGPIQEFQKNRQELSENITTVLYNIEEYRGLLAKLKYNKSIEATLLNSDSSLIEKYNKEIAELEEKVGTLNEEFSTLELTGKNISESIANERTLVEKYNQYIQACSKSASASTMLSTALSEIKLLESLLASKESISKELEEVLLKIEKNNKKRGETVNQLTSLRIQLGQVKTLENKLEYLNKTYKPTETVSTALSPTTGIPLILIKLYLAETEKIANDVLNTAFNGEFQIKFETTEKDFKIHVLAKDNVKDDIKLASQGEIALTTISISLALIEQSIGEYNILCLDEIDGPLDPFNRENFLNILNGQINKLGIEQVFIISHNNAFDSCPMDLVLLPGNTFDPDNSINQNKNVIFDYNRN